MNKALMISIQPQHAVNILNGKKTLELRTWIPKGYVGWVYVYVTKTIRNYKMSYYYQPKNQEKIYRLHGNIPLRFWFDEYDTLEYIHEWDESDYLIKIKYSGGTIPTNQFWYIDSNYLDNLCLDYQNVLDYGFREKPTPHQKTLYAWHIKKLEVFDEPKHLSEFYKETNKDYGHLSACEFSPFDYDNDYETCLNTFRLKKAPQKFCYVVEE